MLTAGTPAPEIWNDLDPHPWDPNKMHLWVAEFNKPRLFKRNGEWLCRYRGRLFAGPTVESAYWQAEASSLSQNAH